jgi:hypothetical protein
MKYYVHGGKEKRNILHTIKGRKANFIGHFVRRNCLLINFTEERIKVRLEVVRKRGRRRKQLPDDLNEKRGYWKLREEVKNNIYICFQSNTTIFYDSTYRQVSVTRPSVH